MTKTIHKIYIWTMVLVTIVVTIYLAYYGYSYYSTPLEERFYHPQYDWFKSSGIFGHGLGIVGTLMVTFGVAIYIARKRYNFMTRYLRLKYLLEFHIFLCTLGPILILFHTAFKFGGIVSVSFWSMVAVVLSGVIGRFIYIQIPRSIEGRELSLNEVKNMKSDLALQLDNNANLDERSIELIKNSTDDSGAKVPVLKKYFMDKKAIRQIRKLLTQKGLDATAKADILGMVKREISLSNKIYRLETMQQLFKYWHVAHLPFALIMFIILIIHVGVTLAFGYRWIF